MLFAPTFADKAILPTAWGGRYFFNRIGRKWTLECACETSVDSAELSGVPVRVIQALMERS